MVNIDHQNKRTDVIVISTGGTIEKSYDEFDGSLSNKESMVKNIILEKLRLPYTYINVFTIISKDSLNFTDYDRSLLVKTIETHMSKDIPIVVLHGTDTMARSANEVFSKIEKPTVPIVFTGAMRPMGFEDTDAKQNVTEALLASKILDPGVYISFHNKIFTLPNVRKNPEKRTFEAF